MDKFDINSFTKEQMTKAMACKMPEELIELAKKAGIELTTEQAKAYLDELENIELDEAALEKIAGGDSYLKCSHCSRVCSHHQF